MPTNIFPACQVFTLLVKKKFLLLESSAISSSHPLTREYTLRYVAGYVCRIGIQGGMI